MACKDHKRLANAALEVMLDPTSRNRRALGKALEASGVDWIAAQKERLKAEHERWVKAGWDGGPG